MGSVIVVGAGVAGAVAAATALEMGFSVEVHEAGPGLPLPPELRSADLNRALAVRDRWWDAPYLAGRGLGGSSAINGMVLQRPAVRDEAVDWAWTGFAPVRAQPGPLGDALLVTGQSLPGVEAEIAWLALRDGRRRTAADVWLQARDRLAVFSKSTTSAEDIGRWLDDGRSVLVAAGALRSPGLVDVEPNPARDHPSAVVGFSVPRPLQLTSPDVEVATGLLRRHGAQLLILERAGNDPARAALVVSAMTDDPDGRVLQGGVELAHLLLAGIGVEGSVMDGPAPVAHACCTLSGLCLPVPVVDAATLTELPDVNPMVVVAAHARRTTVAALDGGCGGRH